MTHLHELLDLDGEFELNWLITVLENLLVKTMLERSVSPEADVSRHGQSVTDSFKPLFCHIIHLILISKSEHNECVLLEFFVRIEHASDDVTLKPVRGLWPHH